MRRAFGINRYTAAALAFLAGAAAALGQAPWSLWPLALLGYGLGLWLIARARSARAAAGLGWVMGFAHFLIALNWITEPFQVDATQDAWMAPFALVLLTAGLALFWALAGALSKLLPWGPAAWRAALTLAALEAARGVVLSGFPWALPGHIWIGFAPAQLASVAGAGGLTLLTLGLAAGPSAFGRKGLVASVAVLGLAWGFGAWRLSQPRPEVTAQTVRLVQPNAAQALKWHPDHAREFFERHLDLTAAAAKAPLDLIVWPETAVPFLLNDDRGGLSAIAQAGQGVPVALGIQRTEGPRGYNSLAVIGGTGDAPEILAVYDKFKLAPFGEFIPMGDLIADWLGVFSFSPAAGNGYSEGTGAAVLKLPGLPDVQPLICYEGVFPWILRSVERPSVLLQITNDAWFGAEVGPYQHFALARLRAIEMGIPLLRAANTGISASVDARGEVQSSLGLNEIGFLDVAIPAALPETLYAKWGAWISILSWGILALIGAMRRRVTD